MSVLSRLPATKANIVVVIVGVIILVLSLRFYSTVLKSPYRRETLNESIHGHHNKIINKLIDDGTATSGKSFKIDKKIRSYKGERKIINDDSRQLIRNKYPSKCKSENWIVLTTIFDVTDAIRDFNDIQNWCTVIAGDKKSINKQEYNKKLNIEKVIYLDVDTQKQIFKEFTIYDIIPLNHFGRKNLGYLYAVINGAKFIYDTDDDNVVIKPYKIDGIPIFSNNNNLNGMQIKKFNDDRIKEMDTFNIFTLYTKKNSGHNERIWPRGYDLTVLADSFEWNSQVKLIKNDVKNNNNNDYIIQQWLANIEPDFDAIGRLIGNNNPSHPAKYQFDSPGNKDKQFNVEIPNEIYIPFNAQMTTWHFPSFLFIYLPITVHGRVSDIWRSYFAQTIMHLLALKVDDINWKLLYCPVLVDQYRNAHSFIADFQSEIPLYLQTNALIAFLKKFVTEYDIQKNNAMHGEYINIGQILLDLYIEIYEYGIIDIQDVNGIYAWINDIYSVNWHYHNR